MKRNPSRRAFVQSVAGAGAASLLSMPAFAYKNIVGANDRLNIGVIGVGGRGAGDLAGVAGENIVALCDVSETTLNAAANGFPQAKKFFDYRELLEMDRLDAVVVATPDHHHAPATVRALNRGLHVYCEKPLTHTVAEARQIAKLAKQKGVATQMGTQNHEHPGYLRLIELLRSGAIGTIRAVHVITDRPGNWWAQGLDRPTDKPEVPADLKWDLWQGPAPVRDYNPAYVPFRWRGWWDYGCGAIGDMAIHLMDPAFWGLDLGGPVRITSQGPPVHADSGPKWMATHFEFGQRGDKPAVDLFWYEGDAQPPAEIAAELPMNGSLFIGDKGRIAIAHDQFPKLLPEEKFNDFIPPAPFLAESPGHHRQWIDACKSDNKTGSPFSYAGPFTEVVLLGNVAYRIGEPINYDPAQMKITNIARANDLLSKPYRKGWEI